MTDSEPWVATVTDLKSPGDRGCRAVQLGALGSTTPQIGQLSAVARKQSGASQSPRSRRHLACGRSRVEERAGLTMEAK